jgi:hypothetical protein
MVSDPTDVALVAEARALLEKITSVAPLPAVATMTVPPPLLAALADRVETLGARAQTCPHLCEDCARIDGTYPPKQETKS